jgi:alpha-tubulin suppressor-like RCC1 family protein
MSDGSVYGTGANTYGQMGIGTTSTRVTTPVKMQLPAGVVASSVQAGWGTAVVLTNKGQIYTVGNNSNGQLGDGTTTNSSIPKANVFTNQRAVLQY